MRRPIVKIMASALLYLSLLVTVAAPRIIPTVSPVVLRQRCGSAEVEGCMAVTRLAFDCECVRDDAWHIEVRASFVPEIFVRLPTHRLVAHELGHVSDIREQLERHASAIAERRFASRDDCERERAGVMQSLPSAVKGFAEISQRERR